MKVAVTGAAGFIGSNIVQHCLSELGWDVLAIDNLSTGYYEMVDPKRCSEYIKSGNGGKYHFEHMDINNVQDMVAFLGGVDVVFHLAALPRVSFSIDSPLEANNANATGTLSVLEASRRAGVKRVVFSCSSSVYGGVAEFPTPETAPSSPRSPYALQKEAGAEYCRLYSELHGLETVSLLYFNVFGNYQRADSAYATVIPAFFEAAVKNLPCRIDGDGNQSRDFAYIDNVVQANILAAKCKERLLGDRFNIACGETHTVNDVFNLVKKHMNVDSNFVYAPPRLGDPRKSHADISKAKKILGYNPLVSFEEGMRLTSDWWKAGCPNIW